MILAGPITLDEEAITAILAILAMGLIVDLLLMWGLVRWGAAIGHALAEHPEPWWQPKAGVAAGALAATMSPLVTGSIAADLWVVVALQALVAVGSGAAIGYLSPTRGDDDPQSSVRS